MLKQPTGFAIQQPGPPLRPLQAPVHPVGCRHSLHRTIEAYSRRRIGEHLDHQIDALTEQQLLDYCSELVASHSWRSVKLEVYGLKFYYERVLRRPWAMPGLIKPPGSRSVTSMPPAGA